MEIDDRVMLPIPVSAAADIAGCYGYDQVVIVARRVGDLVAPHGEHCTTHGVDDAHAEVAARIGRFLTTKIMGWVEEGREGERLYTAWLAASKQSTPEDHRPGNLRDTLGMLDTWTEDTLPADSDGRIHFARALLECAADAIREHLEKVVP